MKNQEDFKLKFTVSVKYKDVDLTLSMFGRREILGISKESGKASERSNSEHVIEINQTNIHSTKIIMSRGSIRLITTTVCC